MIRAVLALVAGTLLAGPAPVVARARSTPAAQPATDSARTTAAVERIARQYALAGEILVAKGGKVLLDKGYGPIAPNGKALHKAGERWRLASITKQVTATLLVKYALNDLDSPLGNKLQMPVLGDLSIRQLLTHHTGLPNPDATAAGAGGVPTFYLKTAPDLEYCRSKPASPGAQFSYNNCDYLLAGFVLENLYKKPDLPDGMSMARGRDRGVDGFVAGKPEPPYELGSFGAAGGLIGTVRAVLGFDRDLMTGKLLSAKSLAELWKPEGNGSYQALGQWVFPGQLQGCAKPRRIVQRDGEIGGVQARNFIFLDDDLVVIVFTNRSSDDFPLGEVWQRKGFVYDLLSAVACT